MRRSAAPSQNQPVSKRPKFCAPYKQNTTSTLDPGSVGLNHNNNNISGTSVKIDENYQNRIFHSNNPIVEKISYSENFNRIVPTSDKTSPLRPVESNQKIFTKPTFKPVPVQTPLTQPPVEDSKQKNYFNVVWCKRSNKKHKKWEGDAILVTCGRSVTLYDLEGKELGKATGYKVKELETLQEDQTLPIGGREILVMSVLAEEDYLSGKCFSAGGGTSSQPQIPTEQKVIKQKPFVDPQKSHVKLMKQNDQNSNAGRPRHDPQADGALVMPRPGPEHQLKNNLQNLPIVDVVVDPYLTCNLRPHQRDGILFLYQCIMGFKDYYGFGAILADDMGLGKTLQCITLLWTLLKQGPYGGKPVIKKALVITPGSLVKNWYVEFNKWLGKERLNVFAVSANQKVQEYKSSNIYPVLIVSYEMFVRTYDLIKGENFDIVICDEGHRLKNTAIKTTSLIMSLGTRKRIVLTGTPVQNDLQEFFSIVEFCNPNILGTSVAFRRVYEDPIVASRQPGSSQEVVSLGEERGAELSRLTSMFILRRTQEINNRYLPPKVELVLFCKPSQFQLEIYHQFLASRSIRQCLLGCMEGAPHLVCIAALKQLCNHPRLVYDKAIQAAGPTDGNEHVESVYSGLSPLYPPDYGDRQLVAEHSGKLMVLAGILAAVHHPANREKIVIVSNHTKTLNVLERFCHGEDYKFVRLDGSTPTNQRQDIVQKFNNKYSLDSVFLLSSKAGGVGLNLIGASRLVLYDIDWNPANDLQAMARVWRDGQKKKVHIYRLLTTGTIEEKVYQRQISKQGLSGAVIDLRNKTDVQFSREDLKDLFSLNESTLCDTHSLLNCSCTGNGEDSKPPSIPTSLVSRSCQLGQPKLSDKKNLSMDELHDWKHLVGSHPDLDSDWYLHGTQDSLSYIFYNETKNTEIL